MPSKTKQVRSRSEDRRREFVRRFVEAVPSGEMEVTSVPFTKVGTFILPLSGSGPDDPSKLGVGIHIKRTPEFGEIVFLLGKIALIKDGEVITSRSLKFKLLRLDRMVITRWEAFRILIGGHGPVFKPVAWRVKVSRPADFGHQQDASPALSVAIDATGTWVYRLFGETREHTVRYSLVIEAEPDPRAFLLVLIDAPDGNIWAAYSRWASLTGRGLARYVQAALEENDGEAGDES